MNCAIHTDTPAAAFCRTCGKALCERCKREVMGAIYCEPCIAARLQTGVNVIPPPPPMTVVPGTPSPGLAGLLGMIPGVGAMYNGQFMKAFIHVVIFVCLIWATARVSPLIGMLIGFFVIYMIIEAYQTARARQIGQQAPDFLGLEHIFGIHEHQPAAPVNPSVAGGATPAQPVRHRARESEPVGAIVLIVLGAIFMLDNLGMVHVHRMWPLFLIAIGLWIAYKRTTGRG